MGDYIFIIRQTKKKPQGTESGRYVTHFDAKEKAEEFLRENNHDENLYLEEDVPARGKPPYRSDINPRSSNFRQYRKR